MATSGALGSFLNAMMELRSQRLREAEDKQRADASMWEGISQGIGTASGSLAGAIKGGKMDSMANSLMNESAPPVAGGTLPDGRVQAPGMPASGGVDELKLRQSMGQFNKSSGDRLVKDQMAQGRYSMEQGRYKMAEDASKRAEQAAREDSASKAFNALAKSDKEHFNAVDAYQKGAPELFKKINNAQTQEEFDAYAGQLRGMNAIASKRGLEVEQIHPPSIFQTPEEKALMDHYSDANKAANPTWDDRMSAARASMSPSGQQATADSSVVMPQGKSRPPGSILVDKKTGKRYRWDGTRPIPIQ